MSDPAARKFVDSFFASVPVWMTRPNGKAFLTAFMLFLDLCMVVLEESFYARMPGLGTPTALPLIAHDRGLLRGMTDTDASFSARLITWLDRWRQAGSQIAIARAIQDYVGGNPKVKVVSRAGVMTTLEAGGASSSVQTVTWDWDSISNPERANGAHLGWNTAGALFWAEIWIIIYAPPWTQFAGWPGGPSPLGALNMPRIDDENIKTLLAQWKSAHTFVRAVILTYDATLFDPSNSAKMPNGKFGQWSYPTSGNGAKHISDRYTAPFNACRYLEPERNPNPYYPQ